MGSVVVGGARTPMGRYRGALAGLSGSDLGGIAIRAALERAGVPPERVGYVVLGQVLQAGEGQLPARQAAAKGGIPMTVPAMTINKVCLSGVTAVALADQLVRVGEADIVVAGGTESMTNAPHLIPGSRAGLPYGDVTVRDHMVYDGLWDAHTDRSMGVLTEADNTGADYVSREDQDAFAVRSHRLAHEAADKLAEEIVPITIKGRRGSETVVERDEGVRPDATPESLARLKPAFLPDGTLTAGTSSQISDGAAALVVTSREVAAELGLEVWAEIGAHGMVAGPNSSLRGQPAGAIRAAARKEGIDPAGFDLYEINEAFAQVAVSNARELGLSPADIEAKVNVNGGGIALGHPIGMSGARNVLTLCYELRRRGGGIGIASLCGGGGQGDALVVKVDGGR